MPIKKNELPSLEILNEFLKLDIETGVLYWKKRDAKHFNKSYYKSIDAVSESWNTRYENKEAGCISEYNYKCTTRKYINIYIFNKKYKAHRLIYKMIHGVDPNEIDHINGNTLDNRPSNLRSVSTLENNKNKSLFKNNTSGVLGVRYCNVRKRWIALLGSVTTRTFKTFEEAVACRKAWEKENGYHENHGRERT